MSPCPRLGLKTSNGAPRRSYRCAAQRSEKLTYTWLPHTADIRAALDAPTFPALLDDVVAVLRELCVGPGAAVAPRLVRGIRANGPDPADLLLHFAREVLAAFALEAIVPARFELDDLRFPPAAAAALSGRLLGEAFDPSRHQTQPEIKAVTRHGLHVGQNAQGWHAELLFDV